MSKKSPFSQPGVERLVPDLEFPVAVKVTGRNLHAVGLLVSVAGETGGTSTAVGAFFKKDGSLSHVQINASGGVLRAQAGEYLLMGPDKALILAATKAEYEFYKTFAPLVAALGDAAKTLSGSIASALGI